jgi:hypothetical protein
MLSLAPLDKVEPRRQSLEKLRSVFGPLPMEGEGVLSWLDILLSLWENLQVLPYRQFPCA